MQRIKHVIILFLLVFAPLVSAEPDEETTQPEVTCPVAANDLGTTAGSESGGGRNSNSNPDRGGNGGGGGGNDVGRGSSGGGEGSRGFEGGGGGDRGGDHH